MWTGAPCCNKPCSYIPLSTDTADLSFSGTASTLLFINNITTDISSGIRLFADNCVLYRIIQSEQDHHQL